ncbi:MAG: IS1380 family transposase [Planctomycetaceae bacterium]|nr:IS1380 family transposase [Planctomycetaceae bacterium]MCB9923382.1 IS1380 family transposase [Planctomycetaceae bacterium]MCB9924756.1 IS1380 family transposase [Planctomycetaceae bacterium]MCB9925446.1 IS1380 family transposase [Planctomycetaceae bacterium]MCB9926022.1 IS1380 family transposase [Planctomycetaceae bacterium]
MNTRIRPAAGSRKHGARCHEAWRKQWQRRQRRIARRLDKQHREPNDGLSGERPVLQGANVQCVMGERQCGTAYGGVAVMHQLVRELQLAEAIDQRLQLLKWHKPYHESDHVLNFAYNALCDGTCLEDMELRRTDEAYLDGLGARRTPDPTTAGDFCRRFEEHDVRTLMEVFDETRLKVWQRQPAEFFAEAQIDMDGTLVETGAEKMQGIDISYNGVWGYHPLVVSLANTGEVLSVVNRSGNRPSHEGAAAEADKAIAVCRRAGFRRIRLRGDTDFTQTKHLDRWDEDHVTFVFGVDARIPLQIQADELPDKAWKKLRRAPRYTVKTNRRRKRGKVKERIVRKRQFENVKLKSEDVAEMEYRPTACRKTYRLIIVRKNLIRRDGQGELFPDYRYFFYLTNDRTATSQQIVFSANDRCDQENLNAQLKGGVCALTTPVHTLVSNWAYMVMTSLAWNLKAWLALWGMPSGTSSEQITQRSQQQRVLRMEFKTFVNYLMRLPAMVTHTGRRVMVRFISWSPLQPVLFRVLETIRRRRC